MTRRSCWRTAGPIGDHRRVVGDELSERGSNRAFERLGWLAMLVAVLALGCGDDPVKIGVFTSPSTNTRIAGEQRAFYEEIVSAGDLSSIMLDVEVLVEGRVASSGVATFDCGGCYGSSWERVSVSFCAYDSGELRYGSTTCRGASGVCTADGFCLTKCRSCEPGEKCGLARVPWSLSHGWLECVPAGAQRNGDACTVGAEGFDDCAADLHCYDGLCRTACDDDCSGPSCFDTPDCPGRYCTQIPLASPRVGVCL